MVCTELSEHIVKSWSYFLQEMVMKDNFLTINNYCEILVIHGGLGIYFAVCIIKMTKH
jgi:hypothetical protein